MEVLNKFLNVDGVVAATAGEKSALVFAFNNTAGSDERARWEGVFNNLIQMLSLADHTAHDDEIRLVLANTTLLLRRGGSSYVGAVVTKGHPVVKSLQRMIRRTLQKMGAPTVRTDPRPTPPPAPPAPPSADGDFDQSF